MHTNLTKHKSNTRYRNGREFVSHSYSTKLNTSIEQNNQFAEYDDDDVGLTLQMRESSGVSVTFNYNNFDLFQAPGPPCSQSLYWDNLQLILQSNNLASLKSSIVR